jgi:hypothetical protein
MTSTLPAGIMSSWAGLPIELQLMILDTVVNRANEHKLAGFVCVSRDWQKFFERHTFMELALDVTHLQNFTEYICINNAIHRLKLRHSDIGAHQASQLHM